MNTQYFKSYQEFQNRPDKKVNGVLKGFPLPDEETFNIGCWMCYDCHHCEFCNRCYACKYCHDCIHCANCANCTNLTHCVDCENSQSCDSCDSCDSSSYCTECTNCENCNGCQECVSCSKCDGCGQCVNCVDCRECVRCTNLRDSEEDEDVSELTTKEHTDLHAGKVAGYRKLSDTEIETINAIKQKGNELKSLIDIVAESSHDPRWLDTARSDLQVGIMKLVRAVAQPEGF